MGAWDSWERALPLREPSRNARLSRARSAVLVATLLRSISRRLVARVEAPCGGSVEESQHPTSCSRRWHGAPRRRLQWRPADSVSDGRAPAGRRAAAAGSGRCRRWGRQNGRPPQWTDGGCPPGGAVGATGVHVRGSRLAERGVAPPPHAPQAPQTAEPAPRLLAVRAARGPCWLT